MAEPEDDRLAVAREDLLSVLIEHHEELQAVADGTAIADSQIEALGLPRPSDIEGIEHLARVVEIPEDEIGRLTYRHVFLRMLAWVDRKKALIKLEAEARASATRNTADSPRLSQSRLRVVFPPHQLPFVTLDGVPLAPVPEAAACFLAHMIESDGGTVSFAAWKQTNPQFDGTYSNRVIEDLPPEVRGLVESGKGIRTRLKVELLR